MLKAMEKLDLMVVIDPYPSASAAMFAKVRKDGAYLLPAATQMECEGSVTASNRSLQWREKVIEPMFDSRTDHMIMYQLAVKLGFGDQFIGKKDGKNCCAWSRARAARSRPMETCCGMRSTAAAGRSATPANTERLQAHMRNQHVFDVRTLRAKGGKDAKTATTSPATTTVCRGRATATPRSSTGSAELYDTSKHPMDGGMTFRALFGMEKDGSTCWPRRRRLQGQRDQPPAIRSSTTCC